MAIEPVKAGVSQRNLYKVTFSSGDPRIGAYVCKITFPIIGYDDPLSTGGFIVRQQPSELDKQLMIEMDIDASGLVIPFLHTHRWRGTLASSDLTMTVELQTPEGNTHLHTKYTGVFFQNMTVTDLCVNDHGYLRASGVVRYTSVEFGGSST